VTGRAAGSETTLSPFASRLDDEMEKSLYISLGGIYLFIQFIYNRPDDFHS
jgi:hypothetical protein